MLFSREVCGCSISSTCIESTPTHLLQGGVDAPHSLQPGVCSVVQVKDFEINDWLKKKIAATEEELKKEADCVGHLVPGASFAACAITDDTMLPGEN